jgi:hypothetical protein
MRSGSSRPRSRCSWIAHRFYGRFIAGLARDEDQAWLVGNGGMLAEAFVAVMVLIAAASLHPGVYSAMNSPNAVIGTTVEHAATTIGSWGFVITPAELSNTARKIGEHTLLSRAGGAPTSAVGMAQRLGLLPVSGRARPARGHQHALAVVRHRQSNAGRHCIALAQGHLLAPANSTAEMERIIATTASTRR